MRKLMLLVAVLFACRTADAQSLSDLLRLFGIGSSASREETVQTSGPSLTAEKLCGTWTYAEPVVVYDGGDVLGAIGVKALEGSMPSMYAKAGLSAGKGSVTFTGKGEASARLGDHKVTGTYSFAASDGSLTLSAKVGDASGVLHGSASTDEDGVLTLVFDASEAAAIIEKASAKAASNDNFRMMKALLNSCPGVMMGAKFRR